MKRTTSECVDCGLPCLGNDCPNFSVTRFYCDKCNNEETLYHFDDRELCADCVLKEFEIVEGSEG